MNPDDRRSSCEQETSRPRKGLAVVLAPGPFRTNAAKTAHGLIRASERFDVVAVVNAEETGQDAGALLDGRHRGIPIFRSLAEAIAGAWPRPDTCIVGVATPGGTLPLSLRAQLLEAVEAGLAIVNGLHELAGDDPVLAAAAARAGVPIIDVRRPRPRSELHFWTGAIKRVRAPRIAVLGTDCAIGKRTTARLLVDACRADGLRAQMIYTGQTGWMQGGRYGFVLDAVINDFVAGEMEHAVVTCDSIEAPDVIVIEGQSSLRNPGGPCGAEMIVSAQARAVILQHAPGRTCFRERGLWPLLEEEVGIVRLYGATVLAVSLSGEGLNPAGLVAAQREVAERLHLPVVRPLEEGVTTLIPVVREYLEGQRSRTVSSLGCRRQQAALVASP